MAIIRKNFLPSDSLSLLPPVGINGCVAVQADQWEDETAFLVDLAKTNSFKKGGRLGCFAADNIQERLAHFH
jgi:L-fuconolactonase